MNRVKVVGIVLKIYWYPLWLESHMSMCVFYAHWHSHYGAPLHCLSFFSSLFFLSYSNAHMDYLHSTEMRWFIRLSFPGWIHTHKFECMLYFRLVLCYCVYCIFLFNILRGCIRWTTRDIYDGIHLNVQNLWDSCVITCMHSNWLPHHIGWKK